MSPPPPPPMTTTFTAILPDGTTATRKSASKAYTHCLAVQSTANGNWFAHSWTSRYGLAQQSFNRLNVGSWAGRVRVIQVQVTHQTERKIGLTLGEAREFFKAAGYYLGGKDFRTGGYGLYKLGADGKVADWNDFETLTISKVRARVKALQG